MYIDGNDGKLGVWVSSNNEKHFYIDLINMAITWEYQLSEEYILKLKNHSLIKNEYVVIGESVVNYLNSITKNGYKFRIHDYTLVLEDDPNLTKKELKDRKMLRYREEKEHIKATKEQSKKIKNAMKRNSRPWDLLNPNVAHVTDEVYWDRYNTCKKCEHFIKKVGVCAECSCFMKVKCSLENSFCPVGKWEAVDQKI
jgi:hypothetical protein